MALDSMKEIFERSARENIPFWEIVLQYDMEERQVSRQASMAKMLSTWQAIQDAADSYTGTQRSVSGLVGGDGLKMRLYARRGESIGGEFMDEVIVQAISMAESNACMRRIVAAPTAGSCGVVPAVLLPLAFVWAVVRHLCALPMVLRRRTAGAALPWLLLFGLLAMAALRCGMIAFVEVSSFGIGTSTMYLSTVHPLLLLYTYGCLICYRNKGVITE